MYRAEGKNVIETSSTVLAWGKSEIGLPPPFIATEVESGKSEVGSRKSEDPSRLS